jgi:lysophospholipase L1-like esterase
MNKKRMAATYVIALHLALAAVLLRTGAAGKLAAHLGLRPTPDNQFIVDMRAVQHRLDPAVPAGSVIFLGDSNFQSMPVSAVAPHAVNFAISWQRSDQLLASMEDYHSLGRAGAVVVMVGTNDVRQGRAADLDARYHAILAGVPAGVPVVMSSIAPMRGIDVRQQNQEARAACAADSRCTFVDAFAVLSNKQGMLRDDGVHLTPAGYAALTPMLRDALAHASDRDRPQRQIRTQ